MRYFSTFTGIGGFEYGIERAYSNQQAPAFEQDGQGRDGIAGEDKNNVHGRSHPPLCVGYSEIDQPAIKTYEEHYEHKNYGDITNIYAAGLPDFDLIVGGFPCQSFSIAGKRGGFDDTRGTLFFDVARILKEKRPGHLVLENVKGLLSHDSGKTFATIIGVLTDLGYSVEWMVLNSKHFGVPQNRERVYIVGHLGDGCAGQVFPLGEGRSWAVASQAGAQSEGERLRSDDPPVVADTVRSGSAYKTNMVAATLAVRDYKGGNNLIQVNNPVHSSDRVYAPEGISPTINTAQGGNRQPFVALEPTIVAQRGRGNPPQQTLENRKDNLSNTLTAVQKDNMVDYKTHIRRLTPIECERLQGFPDNWTVGSDTQRYKQCGNAVTTNVVQAVIESMTCLPL